MTDSHDVEAITALAIAGAEVRRIDDTPFVLVPPNYEAVNLSHMRTTPARNRGCTVLHERSDFCAFVQEYRADLCKTFGDGKRFVAYFDFPTPDRPAWAEWSAVYEPQRDDDWLLWRDHSSKWMTQVELAHFLEDNYEVVSEADGGVSGAEMLELAKHLSVRRTVDFSSKVNLTSGGVQFTYDEQDKGTRGEFVVPETFVIRLPIYRGEGTRLVRCRFGYRITEGKLAMRFDIPKVQEIERLEYEELLMVIELCLGKVYLGSFTPPPKTS